MVTETWCVLARPLNLIKPAKPDANIVLVCGSQVAPPYWRDFMDGWAVLPGSNYGILCSSHEKPLEERKILQGQFGPMLWKAYRVIIQPAVVITWSFGCMMLFIQTIWLQEAWFMVKFALLLMLTGYTWYCKQHIIRLEKNFSPFSHIHYRMLNEAPTILMVGIIFLVS